MLTSEQNYTLAQIAQSFLEAEDISRHITEPELFNNRQLLSHAFTLSLIYRTEDALGCKAHVFPGSSISNMWFYNQDLVYAHPDEGFLVFWRHLKDPTDFHIGVVVNVTDDASFETIEAGALHRDGQHILAKNDYVYLKKRLKRGMMDWFLMGFLDPFYINDKTEFS